MNEASVDMVASVGLSFGVDSSEHDVLAVDEVLCRRMGLEQFLLSSATTYLVILVLQHVRDDLHPLGVLLALGSWLLVRGHCSDEGRFKR